MMTLRLTLSTFYHEFHAQAGVDQHEGGEDASAPADGESAEGKTVEEHFRGVSGGNNLVANEAMFRKRSSFVKAAKKLYHAFRSVVGCDLHVSFDTFFLLLCRIECNGFGVWNQDDECLSLALYPTASLFNHSCLPNIARTQDGARVRFWALRGIVRGEALTICYTRATMCSKERMACLEGYHFKCECDRCRADRQFKPLISAMVCSRHNTQGYLIPTPMRPLSTLISTDAPTPSPAAPLPTTAAVSDDASEGSVTHVPTDAPPADVTSKPSPLKAAPITADAIPTLARDVPPPPFVVSSAANHIWLSTTGRAEEMVPGDVETRRVYERLREGVAVTERECVCSVCGAREKRLVPIWAKSGDTGDV
ncbi:unnamed protein product [Vitrella brassicaformis CCMP3155]|uniref:SET domain-containing protein n=2 Tax=Vitrella brassicaformis TaxID=1169539 RepID=A0A0G4G0V8_VITBC|nr:unnamed protein product [Vitrella brassicaformis CCMP3155]|eukprot:CEM21546.1 unnamed protein product [Vitrella brassicaformis CCMP3155]